MRSFASVIAFAWLLAVGQPAVAASLQVSPVLVEVTPPSAATTLSLRNSGDAPITAQIRVFRWTQKDGADVLEPTQEVVASPPAVRISPRGEQVVRIVRVSKAPLAAEGTYRILVDELPASGQVTGNAVTFLLQYSVPTFFTPGSRGRSALTWRVLVTEGQIRLTATNTGDRRARLTDMTLARAAGGTLASRPGLVGYVLARSTRTWEFKNEGGLARGERINITAQAEDGPVQSVVAADAPN